MLITRYRSSENMKVQNHNLTNQLFSLNIEILSN